MPKRQAASTIRVELAPEQLAEFARLVGREIAAALMGQQPMPSGLMTPAQAAAYLQLEESTLMAWRATGKGPSYVKAGGAVRYRRADVESFVTGRQRKTQGSE